MAHRQVKNQRPTGLNALRLVKRIVIEKPELIEPYMTRFLELAWMLLQSTAPAHVARITSEEIDDQV